MKLYIVTARCGTSMESPVVFRTREEAEKNAHDYVYDAVKYDCAWHNDENPTDEEAEKYANDNNFCLWDYYYWNGSDEAMEADITEIEV